MIRPKLPCLKESIIPLRLAEAQQLYEALDDPLLRPALDAFFHDRRIETLDMLLQAVRHPVRDTMKEARLAGKVEAYESALTELKHFAAESLRQSG